jgi:hypothetical protein
MFGLMTGGDVRTAAAVVAASCSYRAVACGSGTTTPPLRDAESLLKEMQEDLARYKQTIVIVDDSRTAGLSDMSSLVYWIEPESPLPERMWWQVDAFRPRFFHQRHRDCRRRQGPRVGVRFNYRSAPRWRRGRWRSRSSNRNWRAKV